MHILFRRLLGIHKQTQCEMCDNDLPRIPFNYIFCYAACYQQYMEGGTKLGKYFGGH